MTAKFDVFICPYCSKHILIYGRSDECMSCDVRWIHVDEDIIHQVWVDGWKQIDGELIVRKEDEV